jgi:hypothetical protein
VLDARQRVTAVLLGTLLVAMGLVAEYLLVVLLGLNCGGSDAGPPSSAPICDGADLDVVFWSCAIGMIGVPLAGTVATGVTGRSRWLKVAAAVFAVTLLAIVVALRRWA